LVCGAERRWNCNNMPDVLRRREGGKLQREAEGGVRWRYRMSDCVCSLTLIEYKFSLNLAVPSYHPYLRTPNFKCQASPSAISAFCRKQVWVRIFLYVGVSEAITSRSKMILYTHNCMTVNAHDKVKPWL
jgi:hypothetical protein